MRPALTRWLHVVMVMGLSGLSRAASLPLLLVFAQGGFFGGGGAGGGEGFPLLRPGLTSFPVGSGLPIPRLFFFFLRNNSFKYYLFIYRFGVGTCHDPRVSG